MPGPDDHDRDGCRRPYYRLRELADVGRAVQTVRGNGASPSPGRPVDTVAEGTGQDLAEKGTIQVGGAFVTGQAVLLLWKRQ